MYKKLSDQPPRVRIVVTIRYQQAGIRTRERGMMREIEKGGSLLGFRWTWGYVNEFDIGVERDCREPI